MKKFSSEVELEYSESKCIQDKINSYYTSLSEIIKEVSSSTYINIDSLNFMEEGK